MPAHCEAFCLMLYRTDDGSEEEWIWNSRDGVTPYSVLTRDKKKEMRHVEFHRDRCVPDHVPQPGDRIFVDMTLEKARAIARERVAHHWNAGRYPMSQMWATPEEAVEALAKDFARPGAPHLMVVIDGRRDA